MAARVPAIFQRSPWWLKIASKIALSRLPIPYRVWRGIGVFRHGGMLEPQYARQVFESHFAIARTTLPSSFVVLELGPGDSLATAIFAHAEGAARTYLIDRSAAASWDPEAYRRLAQSGGAITGDWASLDEFLKACRAVYLTDGSLRSIPTDTVDWVFSHAVLEHVLLDEFDDTVAELFRVLKPGGTATHQIDFQDHLAHSLHSLRFSRARWESPLFRSAGFYTNRLRPSEIRAAFEAGGFEIQSWSDDRWPDVRLRREHLHAEFAALSDEDLSVRSAFVVLRKPRA